MRISHGLILAPANDSALVAFISESGGRIESGTLDVIFSILGEGDTAIDAGANIGLLTVPMGRHVGPTGHIVAIEPSAPVADLLRRSAFLNFGPNRVTVHQCALGCELGDGTLHIGSTTGHSSLLPQAALPESEKVDIKRLDDLIEPGSFIRLVKIDVEGSEMEVWRGMTRIVAENPELAVIVEFGPEHLRRANVLCDVWLSVFTSSGFVAYEIDEADGTLSPLRSRKALEHITSINLLLLRQSVSAYPGLRLN